MRLGAWSGSGPGASSRPPSSCRRAEQPYVAIEATVTMAELGGLADRFGEVLGRLSR